MQSGKIVIFKQYICSQKLSLCKNKDMAYWSDQMKHSDGKFHSEPLTKGHLIC